MENTALPRIPLAFVTSKLNADQASGATAGTWTTLTFGSDGDNLLNSLIDRPATSKFRALSTGYYRFSYSMVAFPSSLPVLASSRGWQMRLFLNGTTELVNSLTRANSAGTTATRGSVTCSGGSIYHLTANDYIEVQVNPIDNGVINVLAESSAYFELLRLG